jgi:hypothetical protein
MYSKRRQNSFDRVFSVTPGVQQSVKEQDRVSSELLKALFQQLVCCL